LILLGWQNNQKRQEETGGNWLQEEIRDIWAAIAIIHYLYKDKGQS
jgi:hypothetical protein